MDEAVKIFYIDHQEKSRKKIAFLHVVRFGIFKKNQVEHILKGARI